MVPSCFVGESEPSRNHPIIVEDVAAAAIALSDVVRVVAGHPADHAPDRDGARAALVRRAENQLVEDGIVGHQCTGLRSTTSNLGSSPRRRSSSTVGASAK